MVLEGKEPQKVFKYFEEICSIPHGSGNTKKISDYLVAFAKGKGYPYIQDEHDNVVIYKEASAGYEHAPVVILQGHIDMVCEKAADVDIDFKNEGLRLRCDGNVIYAEGTTLGGDDGIAVAYMLAILDSEDTLHPAIECVFTSDEEIGLLGANALDCSVLRGRILLNIDSEEEGKLLTSCAGGVTASCSLPVQYENLQVANGISDAGKAYCLTIEGVTGGHSGVCIDRQGANAVKLLGRVLYALFEEYDIGLIDIGGGNKDNAIPRSAYAHLLFRERSYDSMEAIENKLRKLESILRKEYRHTDKNICISLKPVQFVDSVCYAQNEDSAPACVMTKDSFEKVLAALAGLPNGVIKYSRDIEGLVQTSLNLGILKTNSSDKPCVDFQFSVRSSVGTEKEALIGRMKCLMECLGGAITISGNYPAWEYKENSKLRDIMVSCYETLYGEKPELIAIHAGLECGIFAGKLAGLDCVSFGPNIENIHTIEEKLYIDSVGRTWEYILLILKNIK
ncbi:MAG: aminoacyl-histidine dipeptidase [Clostridium sp.]|nr:aminoacyl-histidine dipeptidase [Clostridium sp.]MCM1209531.1 aminoacyl-histidine dipeptidase [Ruminococcus sp.]